LSVLTTEVKNQNLRETAIKSLAGFAGVSAVESILQQLAEVETISRFGRQAAKKALRVLRAGSLDRDALTLGARKHEREQRDVFLCHAAEDKDEIVSPLARELERSAITYWLDKHQIAWGDSISEEVNEGISCSHYVLAVVTPRFLTKNWPQRELNAWIGLEARTGLVRILVLMAGDQEHRRAVFDRFPLLSDKLYIDWNGDPSFVAEALKRRLGKARTRKTLPEGTPNVYPQREGRQVVREGPPVADPSALGSPLRLGSTELVDGEFALRIRGVWWSQNHDKYPMYLRVEMSYAAREPDAIKRAYVEMLGQTAETEDDDRLGVLNATDHKTMTLKFYPPLLDKQSRAVTLVLQTVRGRTAKAGFEAAPSGWQPDGLWREFRPY